MQFYKLLKNFKLDYLYILPVLFFFIAFLYSMVGFGGGSSYLAIMSFFSLTFPALRAIALICNIVVVSNNLYIQKSAKTLSLKRGFLYASASIPMAYLGASLKISEQFFFILLGASLLIAAILMWFKEYWETIKKSKNPSNFFRIIFGAFLGFISGMVGIGGGIFLAPLIFIFNLEPIKTIPSLCSFFILVNSISAFFGQYFSYSIEFNYQLLAYLVLAVFIGGSLGANFSTKKISEKGLRKLTALLIALVSLNIIIKNI